MKTILKLLGWVLWYPPTLLLTGVLLIVAVKKYGAVIDPHARNGQYILNKPEWFSRYDAFMIRTNRVFGIF